jgi:hypothetical protein
MDLALNTTYLKKLKYVGTKMAPHIEIEFLWNVQKKKISNFGIFVVGLAFVGKDIVLRFILMYRSILRDFVP